MSTCRIETSLAFIHFRFVRQDTCDDIYYDLKINIQDSNVCARSTSGDACGGDSGGGLVRERGG